MILKDILIPFMNFILSLYHLIFISTYLFSSLLSCQANDWERHPNPIHEHYLFSLSSYPFIILSFHHYFLVRPMIGKDIPIPYMNIAVSLVSFTVPLLLGIAFKRKWPKKALALSKRVIQHSSNWPKEQLCVPLFDQISLTSLIDYWISVSSHIHSWLTCFGIQTNFRIAKVSRPFFFVVLIILPVTGTWFNLDLCNYAKKNHAKLQKYEKKWWQNTGSTSTSSTSARGGTLSLGLLLVFWVTSSVLSLLQSPGLIYWMNLHYLKK